MTTLYNEYQASQSNSSSFSLTVPYPLPPAQIIRTSLPFAIYYQHPSSHQPLNPVQHPPSCTYQYMQAPHFSPFQVFQTIESIPPEIVVGLVQISPDSTPNKENQITMVINGEPDLFLERDGPHEKLKKERATQNRNANNRNNGTHRQQRNKLKRQLKWRPKM